MLKAILGLIITCLINPLMLVTGLTYGLVAEQISENLRAGQDEVAVDESLKKLNPKSFGDCRRGRDSQ